jgi:hypothetical protein
LKVTEITTHAMVPNRVHRPTLDQLCIAVIVLEVSISSNLRLEKVLVRRECAGWKGQ